MTYLFFSSPTYPPWSCFFFHTLFLPILRVSPFLVRFVSSPLLILLCFVLCWGVGTWGSGRERRGIKKKNRRLHSGLTSSKISGKINLSHFPNEQFYWYFLCDVLGNRVSPFVIQPCDSRRMERIRKKKPSCPIAEGHGYRHTHT